MKFLDLANLESPPTRWTVPNWIGRDALTLLVGAGGASKSFLALDLAIALAGGESFLGIGLAKSSVLYVDEDGPEPLLIRRLLTLAGGRGNPAFAYSPNLNILPASGLTLDRPENVLLLASEARAKAASLIVLDALVALHGGDENDAAAMKLFMRGAVRLLMRETGAGIILVHHEGKPSNDPKVAKHGVHRARGSSEIINASDSAIWCSEHKDHRRLSLVRSRLEDKADWPANLDYNIVGTEDGNARIERLEDDPGKLEAAIKAIQSLPRIDPPRSVRDTCKILGPAHKFQTVNRAMQRLR